MSIQRILFDVHLDAEAVIGLNSASVGGHMALGYLPGSVFLGAAAARLYSQLDPGAAFLAFHSGCIRFGPGYLVRGKQRGIPVPLSFHYPKSLGSPLGSDGQMDANKVFNWASKSPGPDFGQPKQLRGLFMFPNGTLTKPRTTLVAKTGINRMTGAALDQHLFAYETLTRGQTFRFALEADSTIEPTLLDKIGKALTGSPIRVGRSRSAEFGMATVTRFDGEDHFQPSLAVKAEAMAILYCFTDTVLCCKETGQATFDPDRARLELPGDWKLDHRHSFIRHRRFTPFNSTRKHPDLERCALVAGSVLVFRGPGELDPRQWQAKAFRGFGMGRETGLGQIWMCPEFLCSEHPQLPEWTEAPLTCQSSTRAEPFAHPLATWAQNQHDDALLDDEAYRLARNWLKLFEPHAKTGKVSSSQWGSLRAHVVRLEMTGNFQANLDHYLNRGVRARSWDAKVKGKSGRDLLLKCLGAAPPITPRLASRALQVLCTLMPVAIRNAAASKEGGPQ